MNFRTIVRGASVYSLITMSCVLAFGTAQGYEIGRSSFGAGGPAESGDGVYELSSTMGPAGAEWPAGGAYDLTSGFQVELAPTDCNEDGLVNLFDYMSFEACLSGPGGGVAEGCECYDVNSSGTVDLADFAETQAFFAGH